ncbi:Str_synth domain-containing protein [Psidium guajava]|nr:Str_synth domain-containing protein [Psidium guajava]
MSVHPARAMDDDEEKIPRQASDVPLAQPVTYDPRSQRFPKPPRRKRLILRGPRTFAGDLPCPPPPATVLPPRNRSLPRHHTVRSRKEYM